VLSTGEEPWNIGHPPFLWTLTAGERAAGWGAGMPNIGEGSTGVTLFVTKHVAILLWSIVAALTGLAVVCIFKPPQDWTNVTAIVDALKNLAFMVAGGWLALLRNDSHASAASTPPTPEVLPELRVTP